MTKLTTKKIYAAICAACLVLPFLGAFILFDRWFDNQDSKTKWEILGMIAIWLKYAPFGILCVAVGFAFYNKFKGK